MSTHTHACTTSFLFVQCAYMSTEETWKTTLKFTRSDDDRQLVFGWAYISVDKDGHQVTDLKRAIMPEEVLEEGAYEHVLNSRIMGVLHIENDAGEPMEIGRMVESMMFTQEKWDALGGKPPDAPVCGWWVGHHIPNPDIWGAFKRGDLPHLSVRGTAVVEYLEDA